MIKYSNSYIILNPVLVCKCCDGGMCVNLMLHAYQFSSNSKTKAGFETPFAKLEINVLAF